MGLVLAVLIVFAGAVLGYVYGWQRCEAAMDRATADGIRTERVRGIAQKHAARQVLSGWMPAPDQLLTEIPGDMK